MIENQLNSKIKALQTDCGKEYIAFSKYLSEHGIIHRFSCPYTHEQNGSAERKHRHITEVGLTLLANASMPLNYWGEAFLIVVYIINRLPTPILAYSTPLVVLFNHTLSYTDFKIFGCVCYPYLRPYNKHKIQFGSTQCVFLGYSTRHKGYLCLAPNGRTYISKRVIFDESTFPFQLNPQFIIASHAFTFTQSTTSISIPAIPVLPCTNSFDPLAIDHDHDLSSPSVTDSAAATEPNHIPIQSLVPAETPTEDLHVPQVSTQQHTITTNQHPMQTRGKTGIFKPKALLASTSVSDIHIEPKSVKSALNSPHCKAAMEQEYAALINTKTWSLVDLPPDKNFIGCKWVFRVKYNPDGSVSKHKARIVAKGFHQQEGFDYFESFRPVVKPTIVRVILTLVLSQKRPLKQVDINNGFLNGELSEEM